MTSPIEILVRRVVATLPDSLLEQKQLLSAVKKTLTPKHPAWEQVSRTLELIAKLEEIEAQLPAKFAQPETK